MLILMGVTPLTHSLVDRYQCFRRMLYLYTKLHGITSKKTVSFMATISRTSISKLLLLSCGLSEIVLPSFHSLHFQCKSDLNMQSPDVFEMSVTIHETLCCQTVRLQLKHCLYLFLITALRSFFLIYSGDRASRYNSNK
jgi:hypothetical protein